MKCEFNKFILCDLSAFEHEYSHVCLYSYWLWNNAFFFLEFDCRRDLWEFFCYGPRGRMNTQLFFVNIDGHRTWGHLKSWRHVILINVGEHVNEMMAVAAYLFQDFWWSSFLIIRQNVNMATNAIPNCGLTLRVSWQRKQKTWMLIFVKSTLQNYKNRWYCLPVGSVSCGQGAK